MAAQRDETWHHIVWSYTKFHRWIKDLTIQRGKVRILKVATKVTAGVEHPIELQFHIIVPRWMFNCSVALCCSLCKLMSAILNRKLRTPLEILSPISHMSCECCVIPRCKVSSHDSSPPDFPFIHSLQCSESCSVSRSRTTNLTECLTLISLHYELTSVWHRSHPQG